MVCRSHDASAATPVRLLAVEIRRFLHVLSGYGQSKCLSSGTRVLTVLAETLFRTVLHAGPDCYLGVLDKSNNNP